MRRRPLALSQSALGRDVQRAPTPTGRVRRYALAIEQVRPVIRIAHRVSGPLAIPKRLIVDHELVLLTRGQTTLLTGIGVQLIRAGSLVLIPPFVEHAFEPRGQAEHIAVHFDLAPTVPGTEASARSAAYRVELSHAQSLPTCTPVVAGATVRGAMERIVGLFPQRAPAGALEASSLLGAVLARLMTHAAPSNAAASRHSLEAVLEFIEARLADPLDAEMLAEKASLSPSRFRAVFGRQMGMSPHRYVTQRRIARARQMLADDQHTLKQIARLTGFADEFHFSKTFRQVDGLPPSLFRAQARASRF